MFRSGCSRALFYLSSRGRDYSVITVATKLTLSRIKPSYFWSSRSTSLVNAIGCRGLATEFKEEDEKEPISKFQAMKPKLMNGAMVLGAGVTAYGISNIIWDMTKMFITLTPAATGYYGFVGGIFSTSILGGLAYYTERWYTIRPETVFQMSLNELNKPHQVWREQGVGTYKSGKLRAFRQDGGYWTVENRRLVWQKPRVQMVYNAFSAHGEAIVTVEASRSGFNETIEFICIDVETPLSLNNDDVNKKRILVKGSDDNFELADQLLGFIEFKK